MRLNDFHNSLTDQIWSLDQPLFNSSRSGSAGTLRNLLFVRTQSMLSETIRSQLYFQLHRRLEEGLNAIT